MAGEALKAERDRGNKDRILISHEGTVYSIEHPVEAIPPHQLLEVPF